MTKSGQAGRLVGKSELELCLTDINVGGKMYPLITTNFAEADQGSFRKTARNAGIDLMIASEMPLFKFSEASPSVNMGTSSNNPNEIKAPTDKKDVEYLFVQTAHMHIIQSL